MYIITVLSLLYHTSEYEVRKEIKTHSALSSLYTRDELYYILTLPHSLLSTSSMMILLQVVHTDRDWSVTKPLTLKRENKQRYNK